MGFAIPLDFILDFIAVLLPSRGDRPCLALRHTHRNYKARAKLQVFFSQWFAMSSK